jgi:hypothetical protein
MLRALVALLLLAPLAVTAEETAFSGVIEMADTISGLESEAKDRDEFDRYAAIIDTRLKQARSDLAAAPPAVSQILREDISFYQAELERIAGSTGRELVLSTPTYRLAHGRMSLSIPPMSWRIDRNRGIGQRLEPDGTVRDVELAPLPESDASGGETGPVLFGLATKRYVRQIAGKSYTIVVAPDLPNACALGAISNETNELITGLARLPGMPLIIETRDGGLVRRLAVTRITPRVIPDAEFAFWR